MEDVLAFLAEHADILTLIQAAITKGVPRDAILKAIEAELITASDAEMKREFPNA